MDVSASVHKPHDVGSSAKVVRQRVREILLPDEALMCIFSKLAAQSPPTLVAASFACKNFLYVTSSHPSLWKAAFFSPLAPPDIKHIGGTAFETFVEQSGGYDTLVRARLAKELSEHLGAYRTAKAANREEIGSCNEAHVLVVVRTLKGVLCLYGLGEASLAVERDGHFARKIISGVRKLQPLFPENDLPDEINHYAWATEVQFECYISLGGRGVKFVTLSRNPVKGFPTVHSFEHDERLCWQLTHPKGLMRCPCKQIRTALLITPRLKCFSA